jgi:hypothetical protein
MNEDRALVVGINDYPRVKNGHLPHCVDDALSVARWLLDPSGGGLNPNQVYLMLDPMPPASQLGWPLAGTHQTAGGTQDLFVETAKRLVDSSAKGGRLLFYFSGHGFMFRNTGPRYREALAFGDFAHNLTERSLSVENLLDYFGTVTQLADQFYFFDCCRDVVSLDPKGKKMTFAGAGGLSYAAEDIPDREPAQIFPFYATQPGKPAVQVGGNQPGSIFTRALVDGLKGAGTAKLWDPQRERYIVRQSRLFSYLTNALMGTGQLPQLKSQVGGIPGHDNDPILASYDLDKIPREPWDITVDPNAVFSSVSFRYRGGWDPVAVKDLPDAQPLHLTVLPHSYVLQGDLVGYEPKPDSGWKALSGGWLAEVYGPTTTTIAFQKASSQAAGAPNSGRKDGGQP